MIVCSPSVVWNALSLDPVVATPALTLLLYYVTALIAVGAGLSVARVTLDLMLATLTGLGVGFAVTYIALGANGGSRDNTTTRAVTTVCLVSTYVMFGTVMRFRFMKQYNLFWLLNLVTVGMVVAADYTTKAPLYKFPVHWLYYTLICCAVHLIVATIVLPQTPGNIVRKSLAGSLVNVGKTFVATIDIMTGDVVESTGLLKACSGDTVTRLGIDEGLWQAGLEKLYAAVMVAGAGVNAVWKWEKATTLEWDIYRRQHLFPTKSFDLITLLVRSTLSSFMMVVYPLQTGRMDCSLPNKHGAPLRELAGAMSACCEALAGVLLGQHLLADAMPALEAMEGRYAALVAAAGEEEEKMGAKAAGPLATRVVSLNMLMATLFTVCTRMRRMYLCMAGALGKDDPGASAALQAHFQVGRKCAVEWHFPTIMRRVRHGQQVSEVPLGLLRDSVLTSARSHAPRATPSSLHLYLHERKPTLKVLPIVETQVPAWKAAFGKLRERTGVNSNHLALGLQGCLAYTAVIIMVIVPQVNAAFDHRMLWASFIVITILEPLTGGVLLKGSQRFMGTVLGVALGLAVLYFTYLCNGLTYVAHPQKFIIMSLSLSVVAGTIGACALRFPSFFYGFIITNVIMAVVALPGYHTDTPMPEVALWRLASTAVGVAINITLASFLFPVTGRRVYQALMVSTLEGLGEVMDEACHSLLPRKHRHVRRRVHSIVPGDRVAERLARTAIVEGAAEEGAGSPGLGSPAGASPDPSFTDASVLPGSRADTSEESLGPAPLAGAPVPGTSVPGPEGRMLSHPGSKYTDLGRTGTFKVVGGHYMDMVPKAKAVAMTIGAMAAMDQALHYEYYPFSKVKRFPFVAAMRAQRLCRHMLNVAGSFCGALDSHDTRSVPALIPAAEELADVIAQLKACLSALAGIVKGTVSVERSVDMVSNLENLTQHLFLTVLAHGNLLEESKEDVVMGVTFLAMLFNASYVVRLLCVSLVQAFAPDDVEALAHASLLSNSTRWAVEEQLMVLCNDLMAVALYPDNDEDDDAVKPIGESSPGWENELATSTRIVDGESHLSKYIW